jgi:zinc transport system permease protein
MRFFADMAHNPNLLPGLVAGLLAAVACGLIGPYVVTRRIVFLSGAIAHIAVGGIGAAVYLAHSFPSAFGWMRPVHGAALVSILAAVVIAYIYHHARERIDTLIGALWAVGMSIGILLIKFTPGYHTELMSYLFGNITYVRWTDVVMLLAVDLLIVIAIFASHKRLLALCLDEQQAALQGINTLRLNTLLLTLVALTVIALIQIVGLILVLALLTLPAATVGHHLKRLAAIMWGSVLLSMLLTTAPRIAVYGTRVSPESAIVLAAGLVYFISFLVRQRRRRMSAPASLSGARPRTQA